MISPRLVAIAVSNQMQIRFLHVFSLQRSRILFGMQKISASIVYMYKGLVYWPFCDFIFGELFRIQVCLLINNHPNRRLISGTYVSQLYHSTLVQYLSYHPDPWLCLRLGYIVLVLWYNYNLKYKPFFFSLVSPSIELPSFSSIAFLINCNKIILIVSLHTMLQSEESGSDTCESTGLLNSFEC